MNVALMDEYVAVIFVALCKDANKSIALAIIEPPYIADVITFGVNDWFSLCCCCCCFWGVAHV
jgi:hypothetical protein